MTVGERIKTLRKEKHLTQAQLGEILGVEKSAVAKWENGRTKNLKRETIQAMALYFGVRPSYIIEGDDYQLMLNQQEVDLVRQFRRADEQQRRIAFYALKVKEFEEERNK